MAIDELAGKSDEMLAVTKAGQLLATYKSYVGILEVILDEITKGIAPRQDANSLLGQAVDFFTQPYIVSLAASYAQTPESFKNIASTIVYSMPFQAYDVDVKPALLKLIRSYESDKQALSVVMGSATELLETEELDPEDSEFDNILEDRLNNFLKCLENLCRDSIHKLTIAYQESPKNLSSALSVIARWMDESNMDGAAIDQLAQAFMEDPVLALAKAGKRNEAGKYPIGENFIRSLARVVNDESEQGVSAHVQKIKRGAYALGQEKVISAAHKFYGNEIALERFVFWIGETAYFPKDPESVATVAEALAQDEVVRVSETYFRAYPGSREPLKAVMNSIGQAASGLDKESVKKVAEGFQNPEVVRVAGNYKEQGLDDGLYRFLGEIASAAIEGKTDILPVIAAKWDIDPVTHKPR
ncbi:hypothetical protein J4206_02785 [Candidatus Woesearchaeota archaeon]|nr:hypothetical protein [Candidatus Woesearchaeota archaeon]